MFEIEDARQDNRFKDYVLVKTHRGIRFYAGIPMTTTDGLRVGALCIIDSVPRRFNDQ
ncbi:GAF domain-containing protein [Halomonas sp. TD01]|uniref:GAF domain-containing protein n=1 Tax=Halomonas sp. TD01 TaxID=999141 RepID=UPI00391D1116